MTKRLEVTMPDGSVWAVPAMLVAEPRARYYAQQDTGATEGEVFDRVYRAEMGALNDADALIDWAQNNMNWSDVADAAYVVSNRRLVDLQEGWLNGEMRVVDEP